MELMRLNEGAPFNGCFVISVPQSCRKAMSSAVQEVRFIGMLQDILCNRTDFLALGNQLSPKKEILPLFFSSLFILSLKQKRIWGVEKIFSRFALDPRAISLSSTSVNWKFSSPKIIHLWKSVLLICWLKIIAETLITNAKNKFMQK